MSKSDNRMTYNMIADGMGDANVAVVAYEDANGAHEIAVRRTLGYGEAMEFVGSIVMMCSDMDSGAYRPEALDFAIRLCTLAAYADIEIPDVEDIEAAYRALYGTEVYRDVTNVINIEQRDVLVGAAIRKIEFDKDVIVTGSTYQFKQLMSKFDELMNDGAKMVEQLSSEDTKAMLGDIIKFAGLATPTKPSSGSGIPSLTLL